MEAEKKRTRLVLAESNIDLAKSLVRLLEMYSDQIECVEVCQNGEAALAAVKAHRPDILLTEDRLPILDGRTLAGMLRTTCYTIILYSEGEIDQDRTIRVFMNAGASDALQKPVDAAGLVVSIRNVMQCQRLEQSYPELMKRDGKEAPRVIVLFGGKGGEGGTTLAVNMGAIYAMSGKSTILLDFDITNGAAAINMLPSQPTRNLLTLFEEEPPWTVDTILGHVVQHESGLVLLASPSLPVYRDHYKIEHYLQVVHLLRESRKYEIIIVDLPHELNDITADLPGVADRILLVARPNLKSLQSLYTILRLMIQLNIPRELISVVLNEALPPPTEL